MSEEKLYIDDGELVYYINENEFIACDEIPMPMLEGIKDLQQKVEQLENIRKEAIKLVERDILGKKIENVNWDYDECYYSDMPVERIKPLLNILNKGSENNELD